MFTPPTEREIRSFSQDSNNDNNIQLNENGDDSSIKFSNVVQSKYLNFQKNPSKNEDESKDKNKDGNDFCKHHKNGIIKNENKFFSDSRREKNRSLSLVNIENGKLSSREVINSNDDNKLNFWNFQSIFQTKKVSFPLQKEKEKEEESKILIINLTTLNFLKIFYNFFHLLIVLFIFYCSYLTSNLFIFFSSCILLNFILLFTSNR